MSRVPPHLVPVRLFLLVLTKERGFFPCVCVLILHHLHNTFPIFTLWLRVLPLLIMTDSHSPFRSTFIVNSTDTPIHTQTPLIDIWKITYVFGIQTRSLHLSPSQGRIASTGKSPLHPCFWYRLRVLPYGKKKNSTLHLGLGLWSPPTIVPSLRVWFGSTGKLQQFIPTRITSLLSLVPVREPTPFLDRYTVHHWRCD